MYVKIQTGQIIDRRTLKLEHSSISLPKEIPADWLAANGYAPLDGDIIPEIQDGQWSEPTDKAQQINGVWKRVHEVKGEAHAQPSMKDNLQSLYHKHLNGGITVNGIFIATGETDRGLINGAVARALLDGSNTKTYKFYPSGGSAIDLTNAQFKDI
ncbi:MAG: hypothetical protein EOM20_20905, partial [Spartobacteria bacterium]|nr:hypothetical protein [Spartobacteria bacterium]